MAKLESFTVSTHSTIDFVKIDSQVQQIVSNSGMKDGACIIFVPHTTAAVTINEGADPDVMQDIEKELNKIIPFQDNYLHAEGNSAAHIKSSLIGATEMVIIENGTLKLGTWQRIYFCEFDGPRSRKVWVKIL
mgnify:FL=1